MPGALIFLSFPDFLLGLPAGPVSSGGNGTQVSNVNGTVALPGFLGRHYRLWDGNAYIAVAHDLQAPLRGIDGYSRLLLEDHTEQLNEDGRFFVETINEATSEMAQLIDELLEYSRLERSQVKLARIEIQPFVKSMVEQKKREVGDRKIDFVVNINGGDVLADTSGFTQALRNYLDNAIKFTRKQEQAKIEIGADEATGSYVLWVRDNGIGFDMENHDRIFGIFQRLNPSADYPGTGLGLAIVRKAMERMGGRAWATSEPGCGSTFFLEIPR